MGSYLEEIFINNIKKDDVKIIFELGSRDLIDAYKLQKFYDADVYAFECNPDSLKECRWNNINDRVFLIEKAVSETNGLVTFYPFDLNVYNNMGASSMLKIDFSTHGKEDKDFKMFGDKKVQYEIQVPGTRIDTFLEERGLDRIDLLCMDLQGYELCALKSIGEYLSNVKYIITECSIKQEYVNGATFQDLENYLSTFGFKYICSTKYKYNTPPTDVNGVFVFDALFTKVS